MASMLFSTAQSSGESHSCGRQLPASIRSLSAIDRDLAANRIDAYLCQSSGTESGGVADSTLRVRCRNISRCLFDNRPSTTRL